MTVHSPQKTYQLDGIGAGIVDGVQDTGDVTLKRKRKQCLPKRRKGYGIRIPVSIRL